MEHMEQLGQLAGKHPLSNLWHVKLLGEGRLLETEVARTLNQGLGGGGGEAGGPGKGPCRGGKMLVGRGGGKA